MDLKSLCFNHFRFNHYNSDIFRHKFRRLFALFCFLHINAMSAATFQSEEFVDFDETPVESRINEMELPYSLDSTSSPDNSTNALPVKQRQSQIFSWQTDAPPTLDKDTSLPTQSPDLIKQGYQQLNTVIDPVSLDETASIIKEFNTKLNDINQSINGELVPAIEELSMLQQLLPDAVPASHLSNPTLAGGGLGQNEVFNAPALEAFDDAALDEIVVNEPTSFWTFFLNLPRYLFNIQNIFIILGCVLLLSAILKILHFVLNRIY